MRITTSVYRKDGYDLKLGVFVVYGISNLPFEVMANRDGVAFQGRVPTLQEVGLDGVFFMFAMAKQQYLHLKSIPVGEKQEPLEQSEAEARAVAEGFDRITQPAEGHTDTRGKALVAGPTAAQ